MSIHSNNVRETFIFEQQCIPTTVVLEKNQTTSTHQSQQSDTTVKIIFSSL